AVPIFRAIMSHKGEECYSKVFEFMKQSCRRFKPTVYMSDFEIGMHNAVEAAFPGIKPTHCYFHYVQAIIKKSKEYGIINKTKVIPSSSPEVYIVIKQFIALALLPPSLIIPTFKQLQETVTRDFGNYFEKLFSYFDGYWLKTIKPKEFSVYNIREDRTDNFEEASNHILNQLLQKNPNPNKFLGQQNNEGMCNGYKGYLELHPNGQIC
ncbi:Protein of unknown function, partial [Cotesia congregata]